ncbi:MAG: hypothetical protein LWW86_16485 [Micrococcales bacterium]|nr:hypothetical protein [Micrococcales bacterium]
MPVGSMIRINTAALGMWSFLIGCVLLIWLVATGPVIWHAVRAWRVHDPWLPFERRPDGRWTMLTMSRFQRVFRAPPRDQRTQRGLRWRWGYYGLLAVVMTVGLVALIPVFAQGIRLTPWH